MALGFLKKRQDKLREIGRLLFLLLLSVVLFLLAKHYHYRADWTETEQFSLSEQSVKIVKALELPVTITAFFQRDDLQKDGFKDRIAAYRYVSDRITVTWIDPDESPHLVKEYGVRDSGTLHFDNGKKNLLITDMSEQAITQALIELGQGKKKKVRVLGGHGEPSIHDDGEEGFSLFAQALATGGYELEEFVLLREGTIPKTTDLLIVASGERAWLPKERKAIEAYLASPAARALFLLDPPLRKDVEPVLRSFGLGASSETIIDPVSRLFGGDFSVPIVSDYPEHPITDHFTVATLFPMAQPLVIRGDEESPWTLSPLARSQPTAWGEKGALKGTVAFTEGVDSRGPLTLAVAIESKTPSQEGETVSPQSRVVVIGDSDFVKNRYYDLSGNSDFFRNSVHWLSSEENLIAIHPKEQTKGELMLTPSRSRLLFIGTVLAMPFGFVVLAIRSWWRRRSR